MFGRRDNQQTSVTAPQAAESPVAHPAGKGRPTPRRKEAEQANRRPLVPPSRTAVAGPGATKEEKKAVRRAQREAYQSERVSTRQALLKGDEENYPPRDQGPARRWARNYVDARRNPGEYFFFFALAFLVVGLFRSAAVTFALTLLLYAGMLGLVVDFYFLRRKVIRETTQRYGAQAAAGVGMYAISRALQIRRLRLPRPQVARGEYPK